MDQEIIREESEERGRSITANKLLCKFGEESKHRQPIEMDAKQKRNSKLKDRRNAVKIVDNDDLSSIGGHQSRSLDLPPYFHNQKSFRINGIDGEFDLICRSLGLSGIDDFSIPIADWEVHRSNSDLATRLCNKKGNENDIGIVRATNAIPMYSFSPRGKLRGSNSSWQKGELLGSRSSGTVIDWKTTRKANSNSQLANSLANSQPIEMDAKRKRNLRLKFDCWNALKNVNNYDLSSDTTVSSCFSDSVSASSFSSYSASSEEEDKKQNEGPLESTSNRNESENENDIGIVRATNVIPVYSFSPTGKLRRSISSWQKGELLGRGSFGTVYEGFTEDGFFFAVKEVSLLDQGSQGKQNISYLEQEISLLKQFEHENIVQYLGTEKDESKIYIFLELVTKGSLASLYQKYHLRDSQVSAYTRWILNGLKYLHDKKVIHMDIKCSNILVDASGSVKLADFGLAKVTKLIDIKSCKGNPFWMAPEVVNSNNRFYGLAADIWSLGCTVLEMLTRQHPYSHLEGMQALFMIGKGKPPLVPDSLSRDARDFILKCLQVNPNDRPTAAQLLDHPFVTGPQNSFGPASPHNSIQL